MNENQAMRFIGDVHGKFKRYRKLIRNIPASIQVGDMGVGFKKYMHGELILDINPPFDAMSEGNHRFIRGNHDNPEVCKQHKYYIPDGHMETVQNTKMMYIGGAISIDKAWRTEGLDYWSDEELSYPELDNLINIYRDYKPDVMITHDCPESIANEMMMAFNTTKKDFPSITRQALESMFYFHQPKYWIFGHWHKTISFTTLGTAFRCLGELDYLDINLETMEEVL